MKTRKRENETATSSPPELNATTLKGRRFKSEGVKWLRVEPYTQRKGGLGGKACPPKIEMKMMFLTFSLVLALGFALVSSSYGQGGSVGYWNFDDQANLVKDISKFGNHGAKKGNATWSKDGKEKGALSCDGSSWIEVPDSDSVSISGDKLSLVLWVNFAEVENSYQGLITKGDSKTTAYHISLCRSGYATGGFYFDANTPDRALCMTKEAPKPKVWYHLSGVYDGKELRIYLNGKLAEGAKIEGFDNPMPQSGNVVQVKAPLRIGAWAEGDSPCKGLLDEVAVFNQALTEGEVKTIMERGVAAFLTVQPKEKLATTWGLIKK